MKKFMLLVFLILITKISVGQNSLLTKSEVKPGNAFTVVEEPSIYKHRVALNKVAQANIQIVYEDPAEWTNEQKDALIKAVDIWKYLLKDNTEIVINVKWSDSLGSTSLANTKTYYRNNFANAPKTNFHYAKAFAKQKDASLNDGTKDMRIVFNKTMRNSNKYSFDLDGIPYKDKHDFITIVLHEITHGLGFASSMIKNGSNGDFGYLNIPTNTTKKYPEAYDEFLKHGNDYLINIAHPSYSLGQKLTSNNIYYDGTKTKKVNNNNVPKIYAPSTWKSGSSISHFDEDAFPAGDPNSLLSPYTQSAEVMRNPGYLVLGVLEDIGWNVERLITTISPKPGEEIMRGSTYTIKWHDNIDVVDNIKIELYKDNGINDQYITNLSYSEPSYPGTLNNELSWTFPGNYEYGWYYLRFLKINGEKIGQSGLFQILTIPTAPTFDPPGGTYEIAQNEYMNIYLNTSTEGASIKYSTDNSDPTIEYTPGNAIPINTTTKIKAKSVYTYPNNNTKESNTVEATYYIDTFADAVTVDIEGTGTSVSQNSYEYNEINLSPESRSYLSFTINGSAFPDNIDLQSVSLSILFGSYYNDNIFYIKDFDKPFQPPSNVPGEYFNKIGSGTKYEEVTISGSDFQIDHQSFMDEIKNILDNNLNKTIYLGLQNKDEQNSTNRIYHKLNDPDNPVLKITYVPKYNFLLDQKDEGEESFGQAEYWENNTWRTTPFVPYKATKSFGTQVTLKADQDFKENTTELMNLWTVNQSQTSIINYDSFTFDETGSNTFIASFKSTTDNIVIRNLIEGFENISDPDNKIYFKDPWLLDQTDATYGIYNSGMLSNLKPFISPFRIYEHSAYKGIFKDQFTDLNFYYTVKFPQTIPISAGNVKFLSWESTGTQQLNTPQLSGGFYETPVVFTSDQAVVTANYKGTQLSNTSTAYTNNSQRKLVHLYYAGLIHVYESMGKIWLEGSTDNGSTWIILNDGKPINGNTEAKNPSLTINPDQLRIAVAFQENNSNNNIRIIVANVYGMDYNVEYDAVVKSLPASYSSNANPVVSCQGNYSTNSDLYVIVWDDNYSGWGSNPGLHYRILERNSSSNYNFLNTGSKIPNTNANTLNPTLASDYFTLTPQQEFHLAWQQDANISSKKIKYYKLKMNYNNNTLDYLDYYEPSSGSGFSKNYNPSITVVNNGTPRLSWIGYRRTDTIEKIAKNNDTEIQSASETRAVLRYRAVSGAWYGVFYKFSSQVKTVNIASIDNYSRKYIMGWTYGSGSSYTNSYIKGYTSPIYNFGTTGKYLQVSNSDDINHLWGNSFQNSSIPYSFRTSYNGNPQKIATLPYNIGREGVVSKGNVQFYFFFGDINADNELVEFEELKDSIDIKNLNILNRNLVTKPFEINSKSTLTFSVSYGITDSLFTKNNFKKNESIGFRIELVDYKTRSVIGVYNKITNNSTNLKPSKSVVYEIDTQGIGEKTVELRLVIEDKMEDTKYSLTELRSNEQILGKTNYKRITFNGELNIDSYSLSQNYPNPFNPQTTINYQMPKDGFVTLKVFDALGKEVATLVNGYKQSGRYNVLFDGSNLASGVYFYKISVGGSSSSSGQGFTDTKKFILVK